MAFRFNNFLAFPEIIKLFDCGINNLIAQSTIAQLNYNINQQTGNLTNRTNNLFAWNESFAYDDLDRLTTFNNALGQPTTQSYFEDGRIKTNVLGSYNFTSNTKAFQSSSVSLSAAGNLNYSTVGDQIISYNAFKSPIQISDPSAKVSFDYNAMQDRSVIYYGNALTDKNLRPFRKYYSGDGSMEIKYTLAQTVNGVTTPDKVEFFTYIGGDAYSAKVVSRKVDNNPAENFYLLRDYQSSILAIINTAGVVVEKRLYDAWGDILLVQDGAGNTLAGLTFFDRGYTGHEHMQGVGLINMNARLYDPKLHRFLQPDNFVQDPNNTQNYNRYGYCYNNPLKYTDPSGESFWLAAFLFATEPGFQIQKYISPIAIKIDIKFGTHQQGLGYEVSYGIPKMFGFAYRESYGKTYYWKNYGDYVGWETRKGYEYSILGAIHWGKTEYTAGEFSQTTGFRSLGVPNVVGITISNDLWGDKGDRYRTSSTVVNFLGLRIGLNLFTGDPGPGDDSTKEKLGGENGDSRNGTYKKNPFGDPNKYRHGVLYGGIGPFEFGIDNEKVRELFQNRIVHDRYSNTAHFKYLYGRGNKFYFQLGWSGVW